MEIGNSCERLRCKESEIRSSVIYMFGNVKIKSVCNRNIKEFNNPMYIYIIVNNYKYYSELRLGCISFD